MFNLAQNCNILYLVICLTVRIFLRHCSIKGHGRWTIVVLVNFPKKSPFLAKGQFVSNFAQKFSTLHSIICHRVAVFWNIFSIMRRNRLAKVTLVSFPQKSSFNRIVQYDRNLGENYATLCPRQLCLLIHSLIILKLVW